MIEVLLDSLFLGIGIFTLRSLRSLWLHAHFEFDNFAHPRRKCHFFHFDRRLDRRAERVKRQAGH